VLFLDELGDRAACLRLLKERLLLAGASSDKVRNAASRYARKLFGDEFDEWYDKQIASALAGRARGSRSSRDQ
jgi:hypothetical protein